MFFFVSGIHLKDMISLHTAHLDKLDNDLINFRKMAKLSVIFQSVTNLQNSVPPVQENRDLIKLLQLSLDMSYSEDEIYELSLAREPRTSVSSVEFFFFLNKNYYFLDFFSLVLHHESRLLLTGLRVYRRLPIHKLFKSMSMPW